MRFTALFGALLAASISVTATQALAQAYPQRPVTLIVSAAPGGGPDMLGRMLAEKLQARWGQTVVVENRPGAGQNLGAEAAARAAPDGYTLLLSPPAALVINKSLYRKLNYDPDTLTPVTILVTVPVVLVANLKLPFQTVPELIKYAKANPGRLNYASSGSGSTPHLTTELLKSKAGIDMVHVPYKSNPLAMNDLLGGQVDVMVLELGLALQHIRAGKVNALAVVSEKRNPLLPDVPAVTEFLPGVAVAPWFGLTAPPKTPPDIVARVNEAVVAVLKEPDVVKRLGEMGGMEPVGNSPEEAAAFMARERTLWGDLIRSINATAE